MASATVGVLRVLLTANSAEFDSAMKKAAGAAQLWSKDLQNIGRQATQVGSALTKTLTLPILALGVGSVKAAMDFESSFANVAKTVDGVSDKTGKLTATGEALAATFRQLAKDIPATTDELNAIAAMGGQMGVPIQQLEHFTRNVAALAVAVDGISAADAAASLASIGNATGTGTTKIQEMASALVHLGNNSNATEADILEFTKRLVGAGHSAGMTVPEVMAIGTAMANVGINAEAGGTAMSTVIGKISKAVSTGSTDLADFAKVAGKSADDFAAVWKRSSAEGIDLFVQGLSTMKARGVDLNLTMGELGTEGIRVASTLKLLAGAGDGVSTSIKLANEGYADGNKHLEEAEKKYATAANQIKILWNHVKDLGITIGGALLPALKSATGMLTGIMPILEGIAKAFAGLPGPVQAVIVGLGLALAAAGPLIWAFGQLVLSASAVTGAFATKGIAARLLAGSLATTTTAATGAAGSMGLFAGAMAVLSNPITLLIAGLGLAALATYKVVTAETELEKSMRASFTEFKRKTDALDASLSTYDSLRNKQSLTKEETIKLDTATRALAEASGLSKEAFLKEEAASGKLSAAFREQLGARKDLQAFAINEARNAAADAARAVGDAKAELAKLLSDTATKGSLGITRSDAAPTTIKFTVKEQVQEMERLTGVISDLEKKATSAKAAYQGMVGTAPKDIHLATEATTAAATGFKSLGDKLDGLSAKMKAADKEIADLSATTRDKLTAAFKSGAFSIEELKKETGLSEVVLERFKDQLKDTAKATKDAETASAKLEKQLDKQREALQKLGIVTATSVNEELKELATLLKHATDAGVPLDRALAALVPQLTALKDKASGSGISVKELDDAFMRATEAAKRLAEPLRLLSSEHIPQVGRTLKDTVDFMVGQGDIGAKALEDAFKTFGLKTRTELDKTATEAIGHFNLIKGFGKATPEDIQKAFDAMNAAVRAAGGDTSTHLIDAFHKFGLKTSAEMDTAATDAIAKFKLLAREGELSADQIGLAYDQLIKILQDAGFSAEEIAEKLRQAGVKGGQSFGAAMKAQFIQLAPQLITILGNALTSGPSEHKWEEVGTSIGALIGGALLSTAGPIGVAVGAMIGSMIGGEIGSWLDGSEYESRIRALRQSFDDIMRREFGTANVMDTSAMIPGGLFTVLTAEGQAAIELLRSQFAFLGVDIDAALRSRDPKWIQQVLDDTRDRIDKINTSVGNLFTELQNLGHGLPASLREYISGLERAGILTQENIDLLATLAGDGEADWRKIQEAVERYGGDISKLGGTFQAQRLHDSWQQIIDDMALFEAGGMSAIDILNLTKGKIIEVAQESLRFGTEIPENMRPWIEKLIESGELVDENGVKITDIGKLKFGVTLQTTLQLLTDEIKRLILALQGVPAEAGKAATGIETSLGRVRVPPIKVSIEYVDPGYTPSSPQNPSRAAAATGGLVTPWGIQYKAIGGMIQRRLMPSRGSDTVPAMLTPGEFVMNPMATSVIGPRQLQAWNHGIGLKAAGVLAQSGLSGGRTGSFQSVTILEIDKREVGRAVADVLPGELRRLGVRVRA